jgi:hypothetical protein
VGVNLDKVKQRQKEEEKKAAARMAGGFRFWSPKQGKNLVRLLPPWTEEGLNADQFEREVYMHWSVGDGENTSSFLCPKKTPNLEGGPQPCPVCDEVDRLRATGDPTDAEAATKIAAKQRFYSNIIDLENPTYTQDDIDEWKANSNNPQSEVPFDVGHTKIQVLTYGPMIYGELLNLFADLDMDLTNIDAGRNIIIRRTGKDLQTKYKVIMEAHDSKADIIGKPLKERLVNLDTVMLPKPQEEMLAALSAAPPAPSSLPPAVAPPPQSLPAAAPAPAPAPAPAATPAPTAAAAVAPPKVEEAEPEAEPEEEELACFGDGTTWAQDDPECVGGVKGDDEYDPCPKFQECGIKNGKLAAPKPKRRRRKAAKAPATTEAPTDADKLEEQMAAALADG